MVKGVTLLLDWYRDDGVIENRIPIGSTEDKLLSVASDMSSLEAVILLLALVPLSTASFATTTNNEDDVDFVYPGEARSERGLPECSNHGICSTLHRRFWLPLLVERLCRCPSRTECPWHWNNTDHHTMSLDNRSQLKFCENVSSLLPCTPNQAAIVKLKTTDNNPTDYINSTMFTSYTAACYCPPRHYWKQFNKTSISDQGNGTRAEHTIYKCVKVHTLIIIMFLSCVQLRKCSSMQFCGNTRADHYSTYYRCSCPFGHMCLIKDQTKYQVKELLFQGSAYKTTCIPDSGTELRHSTNL
uniref:(California timema) hypothetical protein n=1 Tax=Timema californicum TaxID=61474 RepID=A0A7R9J8L6_TIMCA|nr:unnamed protein product [Timema californicum]